MTAGSVRKQGDREAGKEGLAWRREQGEAVRGRKRGRKGEGHRRGHGTLRK